MAVESKVIRVGTTKGSAGKLGGFIGVSTHWDEGSIGSIGEVLFLVLEGLSPPTTSFFGLGVWGPLLLESLGFHLTPAQPWLTGPSLEMGVTPAYSLPQIHGSNYNYQHLSSLIHHYKASQLPYLFPFDCFVFILPDL